MTTVKKRALKVGLVSISDRASAGIYKDEGVPVLQNWLNQAVTSPIQFMTRLIADEEAVISQALIELSDVQQCDLIFTTGGTGPARRDVTPEATLAVASKELPGFGEQMRQISLNFVPTAILSRQTAVIRESKIKDQAHSALIVNLPGQPKSIAQTLEGLKEDGKLKVTGLFASIPYCIELIGGPIVTTNDDVVKAFRPKPKDVAK